MQYTHVIIFFYRLLQMYWISTRTLTRKWKFDVIDRRYIVLSYGKEYTAGLYIDDLLLRKNTRCIPMKWDLSADRPQMLQWEVFQTFLNELFFSILCEQYNMYCLRCFEQKSIFYTLENRSWQTFCVLIWKNTLQLLMKAMF